MDLGGLRLTTSRSSSIRTREVAPNWAPLRIGRPSDCCGSVGANLATADANDGPEQPWMGLDRGAGRRQGQDGYGRSWTLLILLPIRCSDPARDDRQGSRRLLRGLGDRLMYSSALGACWPELRVG